MAGSVSGGVEADFLADAAFDPAAIAWHLASSGCPQTRPVVFMELMACQTRGWVGSRTRWIAIGRRMTGLVFHLVPSMPLAMHTKSKTRSAPGIDVRE